MNLIALPVLRNTAPAVRTIIVIGAFLLSTRFVLGLAHLLQMGPRKVMVAWLVLTWAIPVIIETIRSAIASDYENDRMSPIAMISPPAEIYQSWSHSPMVHTNSYLGLALQWAMMCWLWLGWKPRYALHEI